MTVAILRFAHRETTDLDWPIIEELIGIIGGADMADSGRISSTAYGPVSGLPPELNKVSLTRIGLVVSKLNHCVWRHRPRRMTSSSRRDIKRVVTSLDVEIVPTSCVFCRLLFASRIINVLWINCNVYGWVIFQCLPRLWLHMHSAHCRWLRKHCISLMLAISFYHRRSFPRCAPPPSL